jgi:hypothetical protein
MGPELMSYGSLTGESYLSDLTLAFLEDTGFYQPEYDEAGRLLPPAANDVAAGEVEPSEAGTSVQTASEAMTKVRRVLPCGDCMAVCMAVCVLAVVLCAATGLCKVGCVCIARTLRVFAGVYSIANIHPSPLFVPSLPPPPRSIGIGEAFAGVPPVGA